MKIRTIIAPSAAGKSHWCKANAWCLDGDRVKFIARVYSICGEKFGDRWWLGDDAAAKLREKDRMMAGLKLKVASLGQWVATAELELSDYGSIFVIPSAQTLVDQSVKRNNPLQPIYTLEQAEANRSYYVARAKRLRALTFTSFDEVTCKPGGVS